MRYFGSEAVLALIPGNSQKGAVNIWVVFQCITAKRVAFSSLHRNGLINPNCAYSIGVQSNGVSPTLGWRFNYKKRASIC